MSPKFAVVGAGVVGLTTAVQLKQTYPSASVTIIADKFMAETTSIGAAGIYRPSPIQQPGVPYDIHQILTDSWNYFHGLSHSENAAEAGCHMISGFEFYNSKQNTDFRKKTIYALNELKTEKEINIFPGPRFNLGYRATSVLTSPVRFLPYLTKLFTSKGGKFEKRKLLSLGELVGKYDVVLNCTGMGARELVGDSKMYSSRGHIIKVVAPWIKSYLYAEAKGNTTYIFPTSDFVVVGGVRQSHDEFLKPRDSDRKGIWQRATAMVPSLKNAQIIGDWIGLRPMRDTLRLEPEVMKFEKKGSLNVVHNYGHGANGIGMSWGTAKHAVSLVKQMLNDKQMTSKL